MIRIGFMQVVGEVTEGSGITITTTACSRLCCCRCPRCCQPCPPWFTVPYITPQPFTAPLQPVEVYPGTWLEDSGSTDAVEIEFTPDIEWGNFENGESFTTTGIAAY